VNRKLHQPIRLIANVLIATPFFFSSTYAAEYHAICGNNDCVIKIAPDKITTPKGLIPSHRVVVWLRGGTQEYDKAVATAGAGGGAVAGAVAGAIATCWTIILCPAGIIAGGVLGGTAGNKLGYNTDFYFILIGYSDGGNKVAIDFRFKNQQPVNRMMWELPAITALEMGERRSIYEILKSEGVEANGESYKDKSLPLSLLPELIIANRGD